MSSFSYGTKWPVYPNNGMKWRPSTKSGRRHSSSLANTPSSNKARYVGVEIRNRRAVDDDRRHPPPRK